ncbi:MAG: hypothetical protein LBL93_06625 [Ruminococcus sp.]|nr:hypothetical protein [Ruminococcus sp.]
MSASIYQEKVIETYVDIAEDTAQKIGEQIDWDNAEKWLNEKNENDTDWQANEEKVLAGKQFREIDYLIAGIFKDDGFHCLFDADQNPEAHWELGYIYSKEQFFKDNEYITDIYKEWEMFQNGEKVSYSLESSDEYLATPAILSIYIPFTDSTGRVRGYVIPSYDYEKLENIQIQYIKDNFLMTIIVSLVVFLIVFYFTKFVVINKITQHTVKARKFMEEKTDYSFTDRRNTKNEVVILEEVLEALYAKIDERLKDDEKST